jgi:hypothetical protein
MTEVEHLARRRVMAASEKLALPKQFEVGSGKRSSPRRLLSKRPGRLGMPNSAISGVTRAMAGVVPVQHGGVVTVGG